MIPAALLLLALAADPAAPAAGQAAQAPAPATSPAPAKDAAKAPAKGSGPKLQNEREKTLYALGVAAAESFKVFKLTPHELAVVERGLSDAVLGKPIAVDMAVYRPKVNELATSSYGDRSRAAIVHFAKQKGAVVLPSGVIYFEVRKGTGASPTAADSVKVEYEGKLPDGTTFDSSARQGGAVVAALSSAIRCWQDGLKKMQVGGRARIVCPPDVAYGDAGKPPSIPPKSALIFDVDLVSIETPAAAKPAAAEPPTAKPAQ
jgi:FKBP-type peptidyl-prolyl cis-trans isomerase FkpA